MSLADVYREHFDRPDPILQTSPTSALGMLSRDVEGALKSPAAQAKGSGRDDARQAPGPGRAQAGIPDPSAQRLERRRALLKSAAAGVALVAPSLARREWWPTSQPRVVHYALSMLDVVPTFGACIFVLFVALSVAAVLDYEYVRAITWSFGAFAFAVVAGVGVYVRRRARKAFTQGM
jgi:hypothetical protein